MFKEMDEAGIKAVAGAAPSMPCAQRPGGSLQRRSCLGRMLLAAGLRCKPFTCPVVNGDTSPKGGGGRKGTFRITWIV